MDFNMIKDKAHIENRALKYAYSNARIKAMKGLLLRQSFLDELINVGTIDATIELLQRTHYKDHLVQLSLKYRGSVLIELASGQHFVRIVNKIRKFTPKDDLEAFDVVIKKWEILNLKMILNAKRTGESFDAIQPYLLPLGKTKREDFERIAKTDLGDMLQALKGISIGREVLSQSSTVLTHATWERFKKSIKKEDQLLQLQILLDSYAYSLMDKILNVKKRDKDLERIRRIFMKEIDAKNVLTILRLKSRKKFREEIMNYLIKGGTFQKSVIDQLLDAEDLERSFNIIQTRFKQLGAMKENIKNIVGLENALERSVALEKVSAFHRSNLSIGVILGFILLKEEELNNLRKISKSKEFGISKDEIQEMLVVI